MADFSSLKQTIQTYIKQNGNEEITGNILQDVLLAMVSTMGDSAINGLVSALQNETTERQNKDAILQGNISAETTARRDADTALGGRIDGLQTAINGINTKLAEGYIYAGIATPSTNPGAISGKVFYVAVQAGTYTNFGGTEVTEGITILKYNGTSWVKEQAIFTDGGVFDISAYHATGGTLAKYVDLAAALDGGNNIPQSVRKGGMSIKFVQSSDNKYVQYRLLTDEWSTANANWLSENLDDAPTFRSKNLLTSGAINKALFANLGRIDFCKIIRVATSAGYELGYAASPTCFLTELFDISNFVSVTWKYHELSEYLYLAIYDENKNIIQALGGISGAQRTVLVSSMAEGAKYIRATFDWTKHSIIKDWAIIGVDSNDVETVLWDESYLESNILEQLSSLNDEIGNIKTDINAVEGSLSKYQEALLVEENTGTPFEDTKRMNHSGVLDSWTRYTYNVTRLIPVSYGDTITFNGAANGASAPLVGFSKQEYGSGSFVEDLIPAGTYETGKMFTKSVKITNPNIKYVASCGYVNNGEFTLKIDQTKGKEAVDDMISLASLHNYYPNALSKASGFIQKFLSGEDVSIVLLGDSITAVANQKENTNLDVLPPFMERQNWCYWLWKYLNKSQNIIYRRYDYPSFFTLTGEFDVNENINTLEPYSCYSIDSNAAMQFDWNLANYEKTNLVLCKNYYACENTKIEILSNGVATDGLVEYFNGTNWVEANGVILSLKVDSATKAEDERIGMAGISYCRNMRHKLRRVASSGTISIKVSKYSGTGSFTFWGVEQWNGQGVFISNAAYGGAATYELQQGLLNNLMGHRPDLVLFELTLVNNFGDRKNESNSKELMYNDFYDFIWGDRVGHINSLSLKTLSNNWNDWQVVLVVPHWRKEWVDGDEFRMSIGGTPVKYSALECYNVVKGLIKSKGDLEYLDIGAEMKREAFMIGITLEQSYNGMHVDGVSQTMNSTNCFTQDTVHLNNLGSKIYGKYIAPIFDV